MVADLGREDQGVQDARRVGDATRGVPVILRDGEAMTGDFRGIKVVIYI